MQNQVLNTSAPSRIHHRAATPVCGLVSHPRTHTHCRAKLPRSTRSCPCCMWLVVSPMGSMRPLSPHSHAPPRAPLAPTHLPAHNQNHSGISNDCGGARFAAGMQPRLHIHKTLYSDVAILHTLYAWHEDQRSCRGCPGKLYILKYTSLIACCDRC